MPQKLIVEVIGDTRSYERALGRASTATTAFNANIAKTTTASQTLRGALSSTKTGSGLGGLLFGSTAFVGAAIATKVLNTSINAASDLNEQVSRTQVILGKSSDAMIEWSKTTASSMGISQRAALAASATFAGLFQTVGVSTPKAAEFSRALVKLAADLASLQNSSPEEALVALRSGLAGEAEPLRRFNIFLTEARVQQEAMAASGKTNVKSLTAQEKALARYNLILKDAAPAMGNFALTSGGLANEQRTLRAETDDLAASFGAVLIPSMQGLTAIMIGAVGGTNDLVGGLKNLRDNVEKSSRFDGFNSAVEGATTRASRFFLSFRDGIPFVNEAREAVQNFIGTAGQDFIPTVRPIRESGAGQVPGQQARDRKQAIANAEAASEAIRKAAARANASLDQQIRDSATRIAHLKDLIRQDPANVKLQQRLTAEIKKQNLLIGQQKSLNESNARTAQAAAQAAHDAAVQAAADARDAAQAEAERRRERIKSQQFKALGLTPEGLKPTPGASSLLRRAVGIQQQVKGTVLDTAKNRTQLKRIVDFLKKNFNKAGKDVREAILGMLNDISDALDNKGPGAKKSGKQGPLTATHGLRTAQIIKNLGLTDEQADEIRRRLAHATTPGTLRGSATTSPGSSQRPRSVSGTGKDGRIMVESHTTIKLDGSTIANVVTRNQQKARRRNPQQKRGPHRSGGV